jgi:hypothetical protein
MSGFKKGDWVFATGNSERHDTDQVFQIDEVFNAVSGGQSLKLKGCIGWFPAYWYGHTSAPPGGDRYPDGNPKTEFGAKKPSTDCIPATAIVHLGAVMKDGAEKYGKFNWRVDRVSASVYHNALMRHLLAWADGEDIDPEAQSKTPHLAHIMACCAILLDAHECGMLNDDRGGVAPLSKAMAEQALAKYFSNAGIQKSENQLTLDLSDDPLGR